MADWLAEFRQAGALWMHDGRPARPHALLTSGLHSDGYVNCTTVTQRPALLERILREADGLTPLLPTGQVDWVVGSALGAVTFAYAVAARLNACAAYTEKDGDAMKLARFEIPAGARVLVVEDVVSTGGSTLKTLAGLRAASPKVDVLPYILCLVNRSGRDALDAFAVRALLAPRIQTWEPANCPLCRAGSVAVRPKSHWRELTATA